MAVDKVDVVVEVGVVVGVGDEQQGHGQGVLNIIRTEDLFDVETRFNPLY